MEKCHCAQVRFETIVQRAVSEGKDYREVVRSCGAADTCTACKDYLVAYCEERLNLAATR
ncbi:hypothetical protein EHO61_04860 [Leptospira fluminis]|uniref:(2Fe-2S)-binding protein n=2 Tax=Leptospira TaxID=171 RepID=A0A4R9GT25_9LEPT|nr:hypothetical protein [Leptospira fluminis]TGK11675.1 hypothetical protein EHO60_05110 [Leptospira fletcheri]TGK21183.1 hypothetical protein EHO61_04860 [Leptospira fluminis]